MEVEVTQVAPSTVENLGNSDVCHHILQYLDLSNAVRARSVCRRWWWEVFDLILNDRNTVDAQTTHFPRTAQGWTKDHPRTETESARLPGVEATYSPIAVPWVLASVAVSLDELLRQAKSLPDSGHMVDYVSLAPSVPCAVFISDLETLTQQDISSLKTPGGRWGQYPGLPRCPAFPSRVLSACHSWFPRQPQATAFSLAAKTSSLKAREDQVGPQADLHPWKKSLAAFEKALNYVLYCHVLTESALRLSANSKVSLSVSNLGLATPVKGLMAKLRVLQSIDFSPRLKFFAVGSSRHFLIECKGFNGVVAVLPLE